MLPYVVILPLWVCLAILLPLVQTLHAIQRETADRKVWLFYWCLFCAVSIKMYYFGWLLHIPFYVISFFVDIYYETQLVVIAYLVYPKTLGIQRLQELAEANSKAFLETAKENLKCGAKLAYDWSLEFTTARS
ncbi:unnamed protein product [Effrenium voratum]|nr:unnamed protein product [Effrenium voratum]